MDLLLCVQKRFELDSMVHDYDLYDMPMEEETVVEVTEVVE